MEGEVEADILCEVEADALMDNDGLPDLLVEATALELSDGETLSEIPVEAESEFNWFDIRHNWTYCRVIRLPY